MPPQRSPLKRLLRPISWRGNCSGKLTGFPPADGTATWIAVPASLSVVPTPNRKNYSRLGEASRDGH